jgi:VTC domain
MRYERKYRVNHLGLGEVLALVRKHPLSFRTAYPDRQVNNVYLDTHDLHDFNENLMGIAQRRKFRIRWYGGDLQQAVKPVLEVKVRESGLGDKLLFPMADLDLSTPQRMRSQVAARLQALRAQLWAQGGGMELGGFPMGDLRPALLNTYQRAYFVSLDGRFRLTIDHDLCFYNPDFRIFPGRNGLQDPALIVEVKYDAEHDQAYDILSRHLPFVLSRNSKYVTGILLTTSV